MAMKLLCLAWVKQIATKGFHLVGVLTSALRACNAGVEFVLPKGLSSKGCISLNRTFPR